MLTKVDIQTLIDACRVVGMHGLRNGSKAVIQELTVDFLTPPADFLGVGSNPAIFINRKTYNLLGKLHKDWKLDQTIAVKECLLTDAPINVIGIIVHETGHAFNVAANIVNSEANAYIFEIEVIAHWFKTRSSLLFNCQKTEIRSYFQSRLPYYLMEVKHSPYLASLIMDIQQNIMIDEEDYTY